jgi:hypothetical protein
MGVLRSYEGFTYCDGFFVSFWWMLNKEWYKMQNKMCSRIGSTQPYVEPMDFEDL